MGQHWKVSNIEDQIFSFLEKDIPIDSLEDILIKNIKIIQIFKVLTSNHFIKYYQRNNVNYDLINLKLELLNQYETLYLLNINNFYVQVIKDFYLLFNYKELKFLSGFIDIAKIKIVFLIDHALKSYRQNSINNIIDYFILFHITKSDKIINQFKKFLKTSYSHYELVDLKDQLTVFFKDVGNENIIRIHRKDNSYLVNYTKDEIVDYVNEVLSYNFETVVTINESEKIPVENIFTLKYFKNLKKILLQFFKHFDNDELEININEVDIFLNDLFTYNTEMLDESTIYYFSDQHSQYFADDVERKLNLILKNNKKMILYLFSSIQAAKKDRNEKIENLHKLGRLLVKYFKIEIADNTLRNILEAYQINKKDKEEIEKIIDNYKFKL